MSNNFIPLSYKELVNRIDRIPKIQLGNLPTPLEFLPNASSELGINLYIKRDDCTGLAFGGNKTRHLEYIMHKVLIRNYDCILTGATTQSNWCRQTVAAANKLYLETFLVLMNGVKGNQMQGNFLLYNIMGANVDVVEGENLEDISKHLDRKYEELINDPFKEFERIKIFIEDLLNLNVQIHKIDERLSSKIFKNNESDRIDDLSALAILESYIAQNE